jgi:integrase
VLLAAWCGLRRGEVLGLRREDVDLAAGTVTVRRNRVELLENGRAAFDAEPKTDAGKRTAAVPPHMLPVLAEHMASWAAPDRVFVGRDGRPMRGDAIRQAFDRARRKAGMAGSGSMICVTPARRSPRRPVRRSRILMRRLGHASPTASHRYLHAVNGRDAEIASALSAPAAHGDASRLPKTIVITH